MHDVFSSCIGAVRMCIWLGLGSDLQVRWDAAVAWVENGRDWGPGLVETHVREVDKHGEQLSIEFLQVTRKKGADGRAQMKLVRASRDGEDVTAARREKIGSDSDAV